VVSGILCVVGWLFGWLGFQPMGLSFEFQQGIGSIVLCVKKGWACTRIVTNGQQSSSEQLFGRLVNES